MSVKCTIWTQKGIQLNISFNFIYYEVIAISSHLKSIHLVCIEVGQEGRCWN